jgi:AraC family transcriptional regulator of adaptative response/methylated-DNA-[protein]-cysteine methyltransferase
LEAEFKDLQRLLNANIIAGENHHIKQAKKEIAEYFNGQRKAFDIKLHTLGTDFQKLA